MHAPFEQQLLTVRSLIKGKEANVQQQLQHQLLHEKRMYLIVYFLVFSAIVFTVFRVDSSYSIQYVLGIVIAYFPLRAFLKTTKVIQRIKHAEQPESLLHHVPIEWIPKVYHSLPVKNLTVIQEQGTSNQWQIRHFALVLLAQSPAIQQVPQKEWDALIQQAVLDIVAYKNYEKKYKRKKRTLPVPGFEEMLERRASFELFFQAMQEELERLEQKIERATPATLPILIERQTKRNWQGATLVKSTVSQGKVEGLLDALLTIAIERAPNNNFQS